MKWLALGALLIALPATAQMYKCVDARGVVSYSDKPNPGCNGGPVDIRPIPSLSGETKPPPRSSNPAQQDADFRRRQIERERTEAMDSAALAQRCARTRHEIARLSAGTRVSRINEAGERIYLDDAARDARLVELRQQVRGCP